MSKEKRRVPKLRFPGFTEDWEQRKLLTVLNKIVDYRGRTPKKLGLDWSLNGHLALSALNVKMGYVDKTVDAHYGDDHLYSVWMKDNDLYEGQVLFTTEAPMGNVAQVPDNNKYILSQRTIAFVPDRSVISDNFLAVVLSASKCQKSLINRASGGTAKGVSQKTLSEIFLDIPQSLSEQDKVSELIKKLSKIITLHQRKLEHLNLKKKALLQKLFPKNGERYPELRFPGFTDAWEQRKLNEFLSVSNFKNIDNKYNKNDVLSVSGDYGIVNQIEFQGRSFAGVSVSNYGVVETGDIVYTKSPLKLNPYGIIKANRINAGIVSTLYAIYKTKKNCDSKFIEHYFNLDSRLNKYLKPLVNKGAKNDMKVSSENALIGEVCFPHVTEQKLIADFLDRLDLFITLHQRKLEHLQLQKKALLQQMFV